VLARDKELERMRTLVDDARAGTSGALLVHGTAGVGKTALLDELAREATALELTVLRAVGVSSESNVAWSGLSELLHPLAGQIRSLPVGHAAPLAAALALGPPAEADRFAIGVATLSILAAAAAQSPVVAIVDDLQWVDAASAQAILFAGRRLAAEGVALVLARRDGPDGGLEGADLSWADDIELGPLDPEPALALLHQRTPGPIAPDVARRLVAIAAGNPLALVGIPRLLSDDQRRGRAPLPDPLPLPSSFERDLTTRLRRLPERTRRALTLAAAHAGPETGPVNAALDALGLDVGDLDPAEALGVLRLGDGLLTFESPLMRSAAYHAAGAAERRAAHAALASALLDVTSLEARARHLAAASTGPDESVARCLESASQQAMDHGALPVAAELAVRAATLSVDERERDRRRIRAAELALLGGATSQAASLLDQVGAVDDPALRVAAAHVRGRWQVVAGSLRAGVEALVEAAEGTAADDPPGAAMLFVQAAAAGLTSGRHAQAAAHAERALALAGEREPLASLAELTASAARVVAGDADDGARLLTLFRRLGDDDALLSAATPALIAAASALVWLEDFDRAQELVDAVVLAARRRSALEVLPLALVHRAWVQFRRPRVTAGIASATEALELAEATGQASVVVSARLLLAHLSAFAGRYEEARTLATEVLAVTDGGTLTPLRYNATMALAGVESASGRHHLAVELLEQIVDPDSASPFFRNPAAFGGAFQLIEAYASVGRLDDATELLRRTEEIVAELEQPWPKGQVARLHGVLDDDYDHHFSVALRLVSHVGAAEVITRIDWAGRLRGDSRDEEARTQLLQAFAVARRTGFHSRTPAIVAALAALGDRVVASPDELGRLTGQELAVATSIAAGATVPTAAVELFLSPQTVERELAEACRKLGIATPSDLATRLVDHDPAPKAGCEITVLGSCGVRRDGVAVPVPSGRAGTLVQLLAALGGRAPVDEVIEHLWPEVDPEVGRVRLRNVLSRVRHALGDCVERRGEVLALAEGAAVDAAAFQVEADAALALAREDEAAAAERAEAALRLYGGPLLPDALYEAWATEPRERLQRRYVQLLDLLAARAQREQQWDDAARFLELGIEADPDDHDRYVGAAEVRLRQGRRSRAAHLCRRVRELATELGVPPPKGLAAIERAAAQASA